MTKWVILELKHGRRELSDGSGKVTGGLHVREGWDGPRRAFSWEGIPHNERTAWTNKVLRQLQKELGIEHWYRDGYSGCVMSMPRQDGIGRRENKQKKLPQIYGMCTASTTHGDICAAPILDEGATACRRHLAAERKRQESSDRWKEASRLRQESHERDRAITNDLRELWEMACDRYDIDPERRGAVSVQNGRGMVDNEILQRFLRTLIDRE